VPACDLGGPCGRSVIVADERARLAIVLQRIAPDLATPLWRVKILRDLPVSWREEVAACSTSRRSRRAIVRPSPTNSSARRRTHEQWARGHGYTETAEMAKAAKEAVPTALEMLRTMKPIPVAPPAALC
jgi:hypothetical protein